LEWDNKWRDMIHGKTEEFNPLIEGKISQIDGIKIIETCFITDIIK